MKRASVSAVVAALAITGVLVAAGVASAAHRSPRINLIGTVMVTPSTGLTNGETVTVTGSGFMANDTVFILECQYPPTQQSDCNVGNLGHATTDGSGNLPATQFTVSTGDFGTTTCGTTSSDLSNCAIAVSDLSQNGGYEQVTFAAPSSGTTTTTTAPTTTTTAPATTTTLPAGPRRVKSTPSTNLHNGQKVTVTGSGFTPGDFVYIIECQRSAKGQKGCDVATLKPVTVKANGKLPTTLFKVVTGKVGNGVCGTKATNAKKCEISVGNASGKDAATTPISFKP